MNPLKTGTSTSVNFSSPPFFPKQENKCSQIIESYKAHLNIFPILESSSLDELFEIFSSFKDPSASLITTNDKALINGLCIDIKDAILRRVSDNPVEAQQIITQAEANQFNQLAADVRKTQREIPIFKKLDSLVKESAEESVKLKETNTPRILHVSLEYTKCKVGGVGAVAEALLLAQNQKGIKSQIITPFYQFNKNDPDFADAEFVGFVDHEFTLGDNINNYSNIAKSSIYKIKTQNGTVTQYLIQPDPRYAHLFNLEKPTDTYDYFSHSTSWDRSFYLTSIAAATAGSYQGKEGNKTFDVLHYHPWTVGLVGRLIKEKYNPLREARSLPPVRVVQHYHSSTFNEQGVLPATNYSRVGLKAPAVEYPTIAANKNFVNHMNILRDSWLFGCDAVIHVSEHLAKQAVLPDTDMSYASQHLGNRQGLHGVLNGITHTNFDVTSPNSYQDFAIDPTMSTPQASKTPFVDGKAKSKKALFEAGVIADPAKPLFMYVGRYSEEKGIGLLPAMAEEAIKNGAQVVIMGTIVCESRHVKALLKLQKKYPNAMRVYTEITDQTAKLGDTNVSKGQLIRQATDFALIPSYNESCGLVAMEALAAGAIPVSSKVQGLGDFLIDHTKTNFNAFTYNNGPTTGVSTKKLTFVKSFLWEIFKRKRNAKKAVKKATQFYHKTPIVEREEKIKQIWDSSKKFDWVANEGPVDKISKIYTDIKSRATHLTSEQLNKLNPKISRFRRMVNAVKNFSFKKFFTRKKV